MWRRFFSDSKVYTSTINLPKTKFPARLKPKERLEVQKRLNQDVFSQVYNLQNDPNRQSDFVLHDGPPYANGDLHMGHAVNKILKDITLKHHVIRRRKVHYKPGWDCHGLPIELKASCANKSDPQSVRISAREFAFSTVEKHRREFESWGVIGDWQNDKNIYRTTSPDYVANQLDQFHAMYTKGLIFRDLKPVYWSVSSRTALAEAELEYDPNFKSPSLYFRVPVNNLPDSLPDAKYYALVWTTTPWTLPANQAISFNENIKYLLVHLGNEKEIYIVAESVLEDLQKSLKLDSITVVKALPSDLSQLTYHHPLDPSQVLPFLHGSHVSSSKGTGLVHTAPSHGFDDFLVCLKNKIPIKCVVDADGNYTSDAPGDVLNRNVLVDGNETVLKQIQSNVVHLDEIIHSYPLDWRTKQPVFIRASHQWFINTDAIKEQAIEQLQNVSIYPNASSDVNKQCLMEQLKKRPYWCISRQRVWGVPIPVFYHKTTGEILYHKDILERIQGRILKDGNVDFWWSDLDNKSLLEGINSSNKSLLDGNVNPSDYERGQDIMDIWFDSGVSWSYALDNDRVADLYLEGVDQFTGWFQSSLMTSVAVRGQSPYKSIFVHGFTVDSKGQKMSKSLGNIVEPRQIIDKHGVDTLRWWVAAHSTQHSSIIVGDSILESSKENVQRIRTVLKYLLGVVKSLNPIPATSSIVGLSHLDRFMLAKTCDFEGTTFQHYDTYQYNRATASILNFTANELSGIYLHLIKDRLYCGTAEEIATVQTVVGVITRAFMRTLWPISGHLVEEAFGYLSEKNKSFWMENNREQGELAMESEWAQSVDLIEKLLALKRLTDKANTENVNSWTLNVEIVAPAEYSVLKEAFDPVYMSEILQTQCTSLEINSASADVSVNCRSDPAPLCPRCRRFQIQLPAIVCPRCENVLNKSK